MFNFMNMFYTVLWGFRDGFGWCGMGLMCLCWCSGMGCVCFFRCTNTRKNEQQGLRNSVFSVCLFAHLLCVHRVFEHYFDAPFSHVMMLTILPLNIVDLYLSFIYHFWPFSYFRTFLTFFEPILRPSVGSILEYQEMWVRGIRGGSFSIHLFWFYETQPLKLGLPCLVWFGEESPFAISFLQHFPRWKLHRSNFKVPATPDQTSNTKSEMFDSIDYILGSCIIGIYI